MKIWWITSYHIMWLYLDGGEVDGVAVRVRVRSSPITSYGVVWCGCTLTVERSMGLRT